MNWLSRSCLPSVFLGLIAGVPAFSPILPSLQAEELRRVSLKSSIQNVQPLTGIVLWDDAEEAATDAIQLEFSYLPYGAVATAPGVYDWSMVDRKLAAIAARGHQAIFRFYDTYPGKPSTVPAFLKAEKNYRDLTANSEKKPTGFPDWSHAGYQQFILDFFEAFAKRYDRDPRLAYLQVGFGLWSEYHIYDGPEELGRTFPSKAFQTKFLRHLSQQFVQTPWMVSIDAADGDRTPFEENPELLTLKFGNFDDSFLCRQHAKVNAPNWRFFGETRWQQSPRGGEFSYYNDRDQKLALGPKGPNGVSWETAARQFQMTFIIGADQPRHAGMERVKAAGMACGYRFRVTEFLASDASSQVTIKNEGVAPIYYDAYPAVNGMRSKQSLKGLLPGQSLKFSISKGGSSPELTIQCDRLVAGQRIEFSAD